MYTWSLDALYTSFDSQEFKNDYKKIEEEMAQIQTLSENAYTGDQKQNLIDILHALEDYQSIAEKLSSFIRLKQATNTTDPVAGAYYSKLSALLSNLSKTEAQIDKFISSLDIDALVKEDDFLKEYNYLLHRIKNNAKYMLSDEVEEVLAKLDLSGGDAWSTQQTFMTSTLKVDYKGEETTLSSIRNLAYDDEKEVRKVAFEAEIASYQKVEDAVAFAINNIKKQVTTEVELRGYESSIDMTLHQSRMSKSTLDALLNAMKQHMPKFQAYMKHKAKLLGYENGLPWYELFAPIGKASTKFTPESSKDYLVSHFSKFTPDLAEMVATAFDDHWIDFYPRSGKVGGAFCSNLPFIKQSRVLTNFDSSFGDVVTLAHELGHAYHGKLIEDHRPLNTTYTMPVAETASTFNENLIINAAIADAKDDDERLFLIESQLQDLNQIICDIYSRYLFEASVFEKAPKQFLFANDLNKLMSAAQKEAYGDAIDPNYTHPYMWICKSHYYRSTLSYYNFPYAFGGLFARGLYAQYMKQGEAFVPKYKTLLKATTISNVEEVASICDIDVTKQIFWDEAFESCGNLIDQFIELTK